MTALELADSLDVLRRFGLLERATDLKIGDVAIVLMPSVAELTPDQEKAQHDDMLFAASR